MLRFKRSITLAALALASVGFSSSALASNPCTSTFQTLESYFDAFNDDIINMSCARSEKTKACEDKYLAGVEKALDIRAEYNAADDGQGTVGPRRFAVDNIENTATVTGKVLAERVLIGAPVVARNFRFEFKVTGGKSKKTLKMDVCMLNPETMKIVGKKHFFDYETLNNAKDIARTVNQPAHIEKGFGNSTGLIPVMYLRKPAGINSFQYEAFFQERGVPEVVKGGTMLSGKASVPANLKVISGVLKNLPN